MFFLMENSFLDPGRKFFVFRAAEMMRSIIFYEYYGFYFNWCLQWRHDQIGYNFKSTSCEVQVLGRHNNSTSQSLLFWNLFCKMLVSPTAELLWKVHHNVKLVEYLKHINRINYNILWNLGNSYSWLERGTDFSCLLFYKYIWPTEISWPTE